MRHPIRTTTVTVAGATTLRIGDELDPATGRSSMLLSGYAGGTALRLVSGGRGQDLRDRPGKDGSARPRDSRWLPVGCTSMRLRLPMTTSYECDIVARTWPATVGRSLVRSNPVATCEHGGDDRGYVRVPHHYRSSSD